MLLLLLLTWSHRKQQLTSSKSEVTVQLWFTRTAGWITHGCVNNYSYKAHRDTARGDTHATEERNDSCLSEAGRDELLRGCRDKRQTCATPLRYHARAFAKACCLPHLTSPTLPFCL